MTITHKPTGSLDTLDAIARAVRDMELERRQIVAALNIILGKSPAGQLLAPFTDEKGVTSMYRVVAGAGVTITFDTVAKTCTIKAP